MVVIRPLLSTRSAVSVDTTLRWRIDAVLRLTVDSLLLPASCQETRRSLATAFPRLRVRRVRLPPAELFHCVALVFFARPLKPWPFLSVITTHLFIFSSGIFVTRFFVFVNELVVGVDFFPRPLYTTVTLPVETLIYFRMIQETHEEKILEGDVEQSPSGAAEKEPSVVSAVGLFFLELIKVALLAGITIWFVRYFLFKPFYVKGQSMEPTFDEHQYLIVDEVTYRLREPVRGEVIVLHAPGVPNDYYLKRIIGLPGERIKIGDNKVIIYNKAEPQGVVLKETYLNDETTGDINRTLGSDEYFVMGDNRTASYDSRRFGPIKKETIVGRTWFRGWPPTRIGTIAAPMYDF